MTKTLRNRLVFLGTTSFFAAALVAAPVQFSSITPDLAVAYALEAGGGGGSGSVTEGDQSAGGGTDDPGTSRSGGGGTTVDNTVRG